MGAEVEIEFDEAAAPLEFDGVLGAPEEEAAKAGGGAAVDGFVVGEIEIDGGIVASERIEGDEGQVDGVAVFEQ